MNAPAQRPASPAARCSRAARSPSASLVRACRALAQAAGGRERSTASEVDAFLAHQRRRHRHRLLRQGRSRPGPAHRDAADRRRGARHRASTGSSMSRATPRSRPTRAAPPARTASARRHADPPGRRDRAQGADRPRRASGSTVAADDLDRCDGEVRPQPAGRASPSPNWSAASSFDLKLDPEGAAEGPGALHAGRQVAAAARRAGQMHRQPRLHARLHVPDMLHARVIRRRRSARSCGGRRVLGRASAGVQGGAASRTSSPSSPTTNGPRCAPRAR